MADLNGSATGNITPNGAGGATQTTNNGGTIMTTSTSTTNGLLARLILGDTSGKVPHLSVVFAQRTGKYCPSDACTHAIAPSNDHQFCSSCGSGLDEGTMCSSKGCGNRPGAQALVIRSKDGAVYTVAPICSSCDAELPSIRKELSERGKWTSGLKSRPLVEAQETAIELASRPANPAPASAKAVPAPVAVAPAPKPAPVVAKPAAPAKPLSAVEKIEADRRANQESRRLDGAAVESRFSAWLMGEAESPFNGADADRCSIDHKHCGGGARRFLDLNLEGLCDAASNAFIRARQGLRMTVKAMPYLCETRDLAQQGKEKREACEAAEAKAEAERKAAKDNNFASLVAAFKARQLPVRDATKSIKVAAYIVVQGSDQKWFVFALNVFELAAYRMSGDRKMVTRSGQVYEMSVYPFGRYYAPNAAKGITLEQALNQAKADCVRFEKNHPKPVVEATEVIAQATDPEAEARARAERIAAEKRRDDKRAEDRERGKKSRGPGKGGKKKDTGKRQKGAGGGQSSKIDFGVMGQEQADRIRFGMLGLGGSK